MQNLDTNILILCMEKPAQKQVFLFFKIIINTILFRLLNDLKFQNKQLKSNL